MLVAAIARAKCSQKGAPRCGIKQVQHLRGRIGDAGDTALNPASAPWDIEVVNHRLIFAAECRPSRVRTPQPRLSMRPLKAANWLEKPTAYCRPG